MGSNFNFKNFGSNPTADGNGRPPGNFPLTRQPSIYALTFDELQSTMGGSVGKDFGSMNMDELLKNIWNAEETQTMMANPSLTGGTEGIGAPPSGNLQRQGSLTLPRTLSQKTVDEVWKDISKDGTGNGGPSLPQRQQTLGEMTLEEFLYRAGVVREDAQLEAKPGGVAGNGGFLGNNGMAITFQQTGGGTGLMGSRIPESNNQFSIQSSNLPLNVNGVRSDQTQLPRPQQPQIFPKPVTVNYGAHPMPQLGSPGMRGGMVGMADQGLVQSAALQGGGMGMAGLGAGAGGVGTGSPANQLSSDGIGKSNGDMSSVSPVPYGFNGGFRGRRSSGSVEKVVERRQRRMIKNRESAARSRARKQAYTMELEAEVAKLKEENQELRKKQAEIIEMQKNQVLEMMNMQRGAKKQCLRKSQSGPW